MDCTTILAGLPEVKEYWVSLDMLRYLILLAGLDAVSGLYIGNVIEQCETFTLPRSGFSRWYHHAMLQSGLYLFVVLSSITGLALLANNGNSTAILIASVILFLNLIVLANIQLFITLLTKNISTGYMICLLLQLLSLFCSERLPFVGKVMLIGNWGMMARTTLMDSNGIPIKGVILLELIILVVFWLFGWRVMRRNRRGG